MNLTPIHKHLLDAYYAWAYENGLRIEIVIDNNVVAAGFLNGNESEDGSVVLNITPNAVRDYVVTPNEVAFSARFGGTARHMNIPMSAVIGVIVWMDSEKRFFVPLPIFDPTSPSVPVKEADPTPVPNTTRPTLTVVKS